MAENHINRGHGLQPIELQPQLGGCPSVVRIDQGDERAEGGADALVPGGSEPLADLTQDPGSGKRPRDLHGSVVRTSIDHDDFVWGRGLGDHAGQALFEEGSGVQGRDDDAHCRLVHRRTMRAMIERRRSDGAVGTSGRPQTEVSTGSRVRVISTSRGSFWSGAKITVLSRS